MAMLMNLIALFACLFCIFTPQAHGSEITSIKDKVFEGWQLDVFSDAVRNAVLSTVSFPWDLVSSLFSENQTDAGGGMEMELLLSQMALLVPAVVGIVVAVFVPLCTVLFCCCRCCGNCGAKLTRSNMKDHSLVNKLINGAVILVAVGFLGAMACSVPISGNRMFESPPLVFDSVTAGINDLSDFVSDLLQNSASVFLTVLNSTLEDVKVDLNKLSTDLSAPVLQETSSTTDNILAHLSTIQTGVSTLQTIESSVNTTVDSIISYGTQLQAGISAMNANFTTLKNQCTTDGETFCGSLPSAGAETVNIPNNDLQSLAGSVHSLVEEAVAVNISHFNSMINSTMGSLAELISDNCQPQITSVSGVIDNIPNMTEPMVGEALQAANVSVKDMNLTDMIEPMKETVDETMDQFEQTMKLIWLVIGVVLGAVCVFALLGLALGMLCTGSYQSTTTHGRTAVGHCGARCLMGSVCVAFLPVLLVLLVGSVFLVVGGNLTMVCEPIQDYTIFGKVVDEGLVFGGKPLPEFVFGNTTNIKLSAVGIMKTCKAGGTLFGGVDIRDFFDVGSFINVSDFLPDFGADLTDSINSSVQGLVSFDSAELQTISSNLVLSPNMDSTTTVNMINDELDNVDLQATANMLNELANTLSNSYSSSYRDIAQQLEYLNTNTRTPLVEATGILGSTLTSLADTAPSIQTALTGLITELGNLETYIETQATQSIVQALNNFVASMMTMPDEIVDKIFGILKKDIGKCKVVTDVYDTLTGSLCTHFLDAFNVLWAALYTGGIFCTILMIASCCMTKYFRRPSDNLPLSNINQHAADRLALPGSRSADVVLTHYSALPDEGSGAGEVNRTSNNNNPPGPVFPRTHYNRMHQKWKQRRRFITGPFSAGFFQVQDEHDRLKLHKNSYENIDTQNRNAEAGQSNSTALVPIEDLSIKQGHDNVGHYCSISEQSGQDETSLNQVQIVVDCDNNMNNNQNSSVQFTELDVSTVSTETNTDTVGDGLLAQRANLHSSTHNPLVSWATEILNTTRAALIRSSKVDNTKPLATENEIINNNTNNACYENRCCSDNELDISAPLIGFYEARSSDTSRTSNLGELESDDDSSVVSMNTEKNGCNNKHCSRSNLNSPYKTGKIVCSLCKEKYGDPVVPQDETFQKAESTSDVKIEQDNENKSVKTFDLGQMDDIHHNHVLLENTDNDSSTPVVVKNVLQKSAANHDDDVKDISNEQIRQGLPIPIRPFKQLKKVKSPRSAFLYWQYMDAHGGLNEDQSNELLASMAQDSADSPSTEGILTNTEDMNTRKDENGGGMVCGSPEIVEATEAKRLRKYVMSAIKNTSQEADIIGTKAACPAKISRGSNDFSGGDIGAEVTKNKQDGRDGAGEIDLNRDYDAEFLQQTDTFQHLYSDLMKQINDLGERKNGD